MVRVRVRVRVRAGAATLRGGPPASGLGPCRTPAETERPITFGHTVTAAPGGSLSVTPTTLSTAAAKALPISGSPT
eukprot:9491130-Pyramimonas_sp.AAC.1